MHAPAPAPEGHNYIQHLEYENHVLRQQVNKLKKSRRTVSIIAGIFVALFFLRALTVAIQA